MACQRVGDATLADAMLGRLVHDAHRIQLKSESMRKITACQVELDDAYIGGHKSGKRGRGAGEKPVLFAVERRDQSMGKTHRHQANITPAHKDDQWLPSVHIVISNVKQFIGAFIMVCRTNICKSTSMNSCSVSTADIGKISCQ